MTVNFPDLTIQLLDTRFLLLHIAVIFLLRKLFFSCYCVICRMPSLEKETSVSKKLA